jgi:hypothetical protein
MDSIINMIKFTAINYKPVYQLFKTYVLNIKTQPQRNNF